MFFSFNSRCLGFRRMHSLGTGALGAGCSEAVGAPGSALTFIGKMYIYTPKPNICRGLLASCKVLRASNPILFFHTQKDRCAVFLLLGGSGGIRTHVPLRTTAFRVRLVMTTSIRFLILYSIKLPCRAGFRRHLEKYTTNPSAVQAKLIEKNLEKNF